MRGRKPDKSLPIQLELEQRVQRLLEDSSSTVHSVSQLVRLASRQLESRFDDVWVEGEVSNLRSPSSGHFYFTLKDAQAQLSVVIFRSTAKKLAFRIESGQLLRCRGRLTIYETQGRFQLGATHAEPTGLGALQLAFEQLKRTLEGEGLFDARHKKPLPRLPRRIALVTSPTGAAVRDMLRVLHDRCPVRVVICPTAVQGRQAPAEICAALQRADALGVDVIILSRGGGSLEDLWAFNDEQVARTIHGLSTPLISAVGHEIDVTIADFVADRRAATPSAGAEIAVPVLSELAEQLRVATVRLDRAIGQRIRDQMLQLERLRARLGTPQRLVDRSRLDIDSAASRLQALLVVHLRRRREALDAGRLRLRARHPRTRLARDRATVEQLEHRARAQIAVRLDGYRASLATCCAALQALSPLGVLARGYSLALDAQGQLVRDAADVTVDELLHLRLHSGALGCRVVSRDLATETSPQLALDRRDPENV